jgi:hypothetical protein
MLFFFRITHFFLITVAKIQQNQPFYNDQVNGFNSPTTYILAFHHCISTLHFLSIIAMQFATKVYDLNNLSTFLSFSKKTCP